MKFPVKCDSGDSVRARVEREEAGEEVRGRKGIHLGDVKAGCRFDRQLLGASL